MLRTDLSDSSGIRGPLARLVFSAFFLCFCCSVGLAAQAAAMAQADRPAGKDYTMPASGEVSVPAEGGLVFQVTINAKGPFKALFDTGAGVNVISLHLAHKLGLQVDEQGAELGTSSPAHVQARTARVDTLQFGDLLLRNQTFYVIDFPGGVNDDSILVGYELLRRFAVRIDFENQRLTFYDGAQFHYSGSGTAVPLRIQENALLVRTTVGNASGWFNVDSGNDSGTMMFTQFTVNNNLVQALGAHFLAYNGRGFAGPSPQAYLVRVNTMKMQLVRPRKQLQARCLTILGV